MRVCSKSLAGIFLVCATSLYGFYFSMQGVTFAIASPEYGSSVYGDRLIYDLFPGAAGSVLEGTVPEVSAWGDSWQGLDSWVCSGSGTVFSVSTPGSAYIPFTPESGRVYTLEGTFRVNERIAAEPAFAFGFVSTGNVSSTMNWWKNADSPWIAVNPTVDFPAGTARAYIGNTLVGTMALDDVDEMTRYQVILDTTATPWVIHYNVLSGYGVADTETWVCTNGTPQIGAAGFGQSASPTIGTVYGEVETFELASRAKRPVFNVGSTYTYIPSLGKDNNLPEWPSVRAGVDSLSMHVNRLGHPVHMYTDPDYSDLVDMMNEHGIELDSESGNMVYNTSDPDSSGEGSGAVDQAYISELYDRGGRISALHLDGFIRRLKYYDDNGSWVPSGKDYAWIAGEIEDYIDQLHVVDPDIPFYVLAQIPNWGWDGDKAYRTPTGNDDGWGDLKEALNQVIDQLLLDEYDVRGVTIDCPYDFVTAQVASNPYVDDPTLIDWWSRLKAAETLAEGKGLQFNILFNSMTPANQGDSDEFYRQSLQYIREYKQRGGSPFKYMLHSWYSNIPAEMFPENEGSGVTALAKTGLYLTKYRGQHDEFHRDNDYNGWTNAANLSVCAVTNGSFCGYTSSADPQVVSLSANLFPAYQVPRMQIRMLSDAGTAGEVFWKTDLSNAFSAGKRIAFNIQSDGKWHLYDIDLMDHAEWKDVITGLRIDPVNQTNAYFEIDYIHLFFEPSWEFSGDSETLGWSGANVTGFTATNGSLKAISSSADPQFVSPEIEFSSDENQIVEIRMKTSAGSVGQLFFKTSHDPTFNTTQRKDFTVISDGVFHTYTLDMSSVDSWMGNIICLRIDPTLSSGCSIEIDRTRILE